ncbi:Met-10+ like family protein / kelch repeat-containing protein [Reticulomyxa filosa]|uniref:Met-10+ like family protein / kelch repeat-containing protein n=1 Tax=Reticulomyxa filosa TaxID=46433 RepID=X6MIN6_RETFI|nr:Met-10+ like family protein / kelch repeat-containing protein [Reticulomyxa filosa]|eukprot:ETO13749.1 Met-10+ like family protein / kelch repeat-containing protein [Reticulomyxa filosa]
MKRESEVLLLFDPSHKNGMVKHRENGIWYSLNVCEVMFSSGNLTEKIRVSSLASSHETVLDLYAGIGYFTLSFLVHSRVAFVFACEVNQNAVKYLKSNMTLNKIDPTRYAIFEGDNRETTKELIDKCDRVNLGLLPTSEPGYFPAIRALKAQGGVLHVHENVENKQESKKAAEICNTLIEICQSFEHKKSWKVQLLI